MAGTQPANALLTPGEVGAELQIPQHSLRRWAKEHAAYLSPTAYVGKDQPSQFTQRDVEVLRAIKPLKARRMSAKQINERLSIMAIGEVEQSADTQPTQAIQPAYEAPSEAIAPAVLVDVLRVVVTPLEARMTAMERNRRDVWVAFAAGVIMSAIFFLIIVLLMRPG